MTTPGAAQEPFLRAERGDLLLHRPVTEPLRGPALAGAVLELGEGRALLIAAVRADPRDRLGEIHLFDLRYREADAPWQPVCMPDPAGEAGAIPGLDPTAPFGFACAVAAAAKCARIGYAPWRSTPAGHSVGPYHRACILLMRGEYGGDGVPHTRNGTLVDLWDRAGIAAADGDEGLDFEAGWGPDGAVCLAHARVPEVATREALVARYPRLAAMPDCTEETAAAAGALVFNRSARQ